MTGNDGHTKVRYESVQLMADRIRKIADKINQDLKDMDHALTVVTDTWDGEAHARYIELQTKYRGRADHMRSQLRLVADLVERGKNDYRATDVKASRLFTESF